MKIKETIQQNKTGYLSEEFNGDVNNECPGYGHGDGIRHAHTGNHATYFNLAEDLSDNFPDAMKILELGCGAGNLSAHYRSIKPDVTYVTMDINGVSPTLGHINLDTHVIGFTDRPFNIVDENESTIKFDLILSYEHFEHIPEERIPQFLANIKHHSHKDTIIVATAAIFPSPIHPTTWLIEKWKDTLVNNGFNIMEGSILNQFNTPCNFGFFNTSELIFKIND
jgi:2-polyprenyl-3-methyl-5-hydroxy-6-metoxy-1,4-benzoquinol methylase